METEIIEHLEEERLEAYAMNLLAGEELATTEEHLLVCETCQDHLQALETYMQAMRSAAVRIRDEEKAAPAVPGVGQRLRAFFRAPLPVWGGAVAMVGLLILVGLQFRQHSGAPVDVELQAVRGESTTTAPAGHTLHLRLDNRGVPYMSAWRVKIVDSEGSPIWTGTGNWSDNAITAAVPKAFTPGTYYVRLLKETEDPVREYQLVVK